MSLETRIINIDGMTCDGCVKSVHNAVSNLDGIQTVSVDLEDNLATVTFDSAKVAIDAIIEAIDEAGFDASIVKN